MILDLSSLLWAKEMPFKSLVAAFGYYLPGMILLALFAVVIRMGLEEILKHISLGLARSRVWTVGCIAIWVFLVVKTEFCELTAKKIMWDKVISPPEAEAVKAEAKQLRQKTGR